MSVPPCFFHVDLDAFFASVEQLDHPEYRGKPVIVSGSGRRAVVSTCSYEARAFGVHSAMPRAQAERLCPGGIFLPVNMPRYHEKSREVMRIFREFSADVRLRDRLAENIFVDTLDFDIHLNGGDSLFRTRDFEVHIAEKVL